MSQQMLDGDGAVLHRGGRLSLDEEEELEQKQHHSGKADEEEHVAEVGPHDALMARGGTYAELYGIQARAYS